jgi:hypothetical protein
MGQAVLAAIAPLVVIGIGMFLLKGGSEKQVAESAGNAPPSQGKMEASSGKPGEQPGESHIASQHVGLDNKPEEPASVAGVLSRCDPVAAGAGRCLQRHLTSPGEWRYLWGKCG